MAAPQLPKYTPSSLIVKYDAVLFPFDVVSMLNALPDQGYILEDELRHLGTSGLQVRGIVARRADVAIRIDTDKYLLGVNTSSHVVAVEELEAVEQILDEQLGFEGGPKAQYHEFTSRFPVRAGTDPISSWADRFSNNPVLTALSNVLGEPASPFGLRLSPAGQPPNQVDWFDIHLEPLVGSARTHHHLNVVYRKAQRAAVVDFISRFGDIMTNMLSIVEGR